jgi:hypothetical protein
VASRRNLVAIGFLLLSSVAVTPTAALDPHELAWAIVSRDQTSISSTMDLELVDRLRGDFGDEFLYVREDGDRWVIRDRALMKRALDAQRPVREAKVALKAGKRSRKRARAETAAEAREHEVRQRDARERLDEALQNLKQEIRGILHDAKKRHLAQRVEY